MKWIKASERFPDTVGERFHLMVNKDGRIYKYIGFLAWANKKKGEKAFYQIEKADWNNYPIEGEIEWLDESQASDKDKEIERLKENIRQTNSSYINCLSCLTIEKNKNERLKILIESLRETFIYNQRQQLRHSGFSVEKSVQIADEQWEEIKIKNNL